MRSSDYVEDHPALEGTLEPLRIYLTCYRVLLANRDPRAGEILVGCPHLLQERAARSTTRTCGARSWRTCPRTARSSRYGKSRIVCPQVGQNARACLQTLLNWCKLPAYEQRFERSTMGAAETAAPRTKMYRTSTQERPTDTQRHPIGTCEPALRGATCQNDMGRWGTVYSRFYRWQKQGVWDALFETVQAQQDAAGQLDWTVHYVDGTTVRAHQHAAGAKKGIPSPKP